jgi:hypothetical protein
MKNESSRDHDLYEIVVQLSQLQNLTAFKYFTSRIKNETYIDQMREILCEKLASKGEWTSAIEMASQIGDSGKRLWCYQIFGRLSASLIRNSDALNSVKSQISEEGLQHFLKGLVENVAISQCNINLALRLMPEIFNHDSLLEAFIGRYALNELFFGEVSNNKIERFKRTLNVNSALDIKNSFRAN